MHDRQTNTWDAVWNHMVNLIDPLGRAYPNATIRAGFKYKDAPRAQNAKGLALIVAWQRQGVDTLDARGAGLPLLSPCSRH